MGVVFISCSNSNEDRKMKTPGQYSQILLAGLLVAGIGILGCQTNVAPEERVEFAPPVNVKVIPGDFSVEVQWNHHWNRRIVGYRVYRSRHYDGRYTYLGSTRSNYFVDHTANNGNLYYYAVSGYDSRGNETDLSVEAAFTIPRPEGYDVLMQDFRIQPDRSGFEFSTVTLGPYDDDYTDIFYEFDGGFHYMNVWDDTDIIDMGYTHSIKDIRYAPTSGWSPTKDVLLRPGHTYVVWTFDNHFAKFRVYELGHRYVVIDWAYQTLQGEPMLKRDVPAPGERVLRSRKFNIGYE
jgi:hypothetical protein